MSTHSGERAAFSLLGGGALLVATVSGSFAGLLLDPSPEA